LATTPTQAMAGGLVDISDGSVGRTRGCRVRR
jgi:hypothetical protein